MVTISNYKVDKEVIFNEEEHTYYKNGIKYVGVNELLKQYFPEFDKSIAKHCAGKGKYIGLTEEQVLNKWHENSLNSINRGKLIHSIFELYFKGEYYKLHSLLDENKEYKVYYDLIVKFITPLPSDQVEILVSNDKYQIAGTVDYLGYYNGELCIIDWKSNWKINSDIDFISKKMKMPFEYFAASTFNKYMFQLNIYNKILKMSGIEVKHLYLGHVTETEIKLIKIPFVDKEIESLFALRLDYLASNKIIQNKAKKKPFNAYRFGMCCNQVHAELLELERLGKDIRNINELLKQMIKEKYYLYEELEEELQNV